jgi:cytochrome d ubiquinol oxidase subunit I
VVRFALTEERMDVELLSRSQFGFVMSFHILFPAFTIGLAWWLAFLEAMWLLQRRDLWRDLYFFWLRIFAVSFAMGVVSGIVMSFQFGTNWSRFAEAAGPVIGPLLNYEVLTAFFLEATFLGVMLFGWTRVGHATHFVATLMVALGTLVSTFWIISANSWMQTPAGHVLRDGVFEPADWWAIVFNPSFPVRLVHMVLAAFLTSAMVIGGVAAWHLRQRRFPRAAAATLRLALVFVAIVVPLQIAAGDASGLEVRRYQPAKLAAIEARWDTARRVPLTLFAVPDEAAEANRWALDVPVLGSLILTHSADGEVRGLKDFPRADRPPVKAPFYAFRAMVGLGLLMLALAVAGLWLWWRRRLDAARAYHAAWVLMMPSGFAAVLCGWYVTEMGRQPWVVYGLMRTREAFSPVTAGAVTTSLVAYVLTYAVIFGFGTAYLYKLLRTGPVAAPARPQPTKTPARPLSLPDQEIEP